MKCRSCGAEIPADATQCSFCGSRTAVDSVRNDKASIFARIESSSEYAGRELPERLARLPKVGAMQKAFVFVFFAMFIGGSAFMALAMLGVAGAFGFAGFRMGGGPGAAFSVVPVIMSIVPIGFVVAGVFFFLHIKKRMTSVETEPTQTIPVIIVDKRTHVWGGSGDSSAKTSYYATCENQAGEREEYQLWDGRLYGRTSADDAGILFVRAGIALDFDRVAME